MTNLIKIEQETIQALNYQVSQALGSKNMEAFDKTFAIAGAIKTLKQLLTPEIMEPIMMLQGSQLGFKTDKDKTGGYPLAVVTDIIITATLSGVLPVGNQFNIIAGNFYITKEGFEYLLPKVEGLKYTVTHELPRIQGEKAAIVMNVEWSMFGEAVQKKSLDFPIKINSYSTADAVIGKGKRKAYAWLYAQVTGVSLPEGNVEDVPFKQVSSRVNNERERVMELLNAEYSSVEEFQKNVVDRMSSDLRGELDLEISLKIQEIQYSIENKGGANG